MSNSILSAFARLFRPATLVQNIPSPSPITTPASFRTARRADPGEEVETPPPAKHGGDGYYHRYLLVEFGPNADAKRFKRIVDETLQATVAGCSALVVCRQKANGRSVIISFSWQITCPAITDFAFDYFTAALDLFAVNSGGLGIDGRPENPHARTWQGNGWREIISPTTPEGTIPGYSASAELGLRFFG